MLAYLVQIGVRLVHLRRMLKPSGSIYLHCDCKAAHYLKLLMDAIFGPECFLNNVVWLYGMGGSSKRYWPRKHDDLLWYSKYADGHWFEADMVPATSRRMAGRLKKAPDYWNIPAINNMSHERLGYPTQKPIELLKRIVRSSSPPGGVVLDPFCGGGTTCDAVETLNREGPEKEPRIWVGIDITHLAINIVKHRLARFDPPPVYEVRGEPVDLAGARALFKEDPHQFQYWACGLVGARPAGAKAGSKKGKKGADLGIDGVRYFADDMSGPKAILVQVKGGKTGSADIRDFRGTIERENAAMGIFITLNEPTSAMKREAAAAGMYESPGGSKVPKLQIVTIETLLSGGTPRQPAGVLLPEGALDPGAARTVKKAKKHDAGGLFQRPGA